MAEEALHHNIEGLAEDGEAIPEPSALEDVMSDPDNLSGVVILVSATSAPPKFVRSTPPCPGDILAHTILIFDPGNEAADEIEAA